MYAHKGLCDHEVKLKNKELVRYWSNRTGDTQETVDQIQDDLADVVQDQIAMGNTINLPGIGQIGVKLSPPRKGRNPATGEVVIFPPKPHVFMKPCAALKKAGENAPVECFE